MYTLGWDQIFNAQVLLMLLAGTVAGIVVGILPGLGPTLGIAVLTPFTFGMDLTASLALLLGMMCGGTYGGSVSAILCSIPGTTVAMMTTMDGYPMAKLGKANKAIGVATISSFAGGVLGAVILSAAAPAIARAALKFSAPEYFAIALFGISIIAYISPGNMAKGMISGFLGLLLGCVGADPLTSYGRFMYGHMNLISGVGYFPILIGLFGMAEVLRSAQRHDEGEVAVIKQSGRVLPTLKEFIGTVPTVIRSTIIGTFIGAIPAAGGSIATIVAYGVEKRISKDPDSFGKGNPLGVAAPETANNACASGAMIPLLTLGIPGDPATAVLIGTFLIHGLTLGPMLFKNRPADVSAIFILLLLSTFLFTIIGITCAKPLGKIINVKLEILMPIVGLLCCVGAFAVNNTTFDFIFLLACALVGFVFSKGGVPPAPLVLGIVLGSIIESNFRRSLMLTKGNLWAIFTRPIAGTFVVLTILMLALPSIIAILSRWSSKIKTMEETRSNLED